MIIDWRLVMFCIAWRVSWVFGIQERRSDRDVLGMAVEFLDPDWEVELQRGKGKGSIRSAPASNILYCAARAQRSKVLVPAHEYDEGLVRST